MVSMCVVVEERQCDVPVRVAGSGLLGFRSSLLTRFVTMGK